ncbi:glycosyltransferase family 4 protein [Brucella intermedia]|uniref:glycosyltransferase family 4 protein n=1 Tax=Brucella intermedia TaxID=94625 RepID=UPI00224B64CE|nr:glycosyltransferase family 1 protein [Brucella intermedia]
MKIGIDARNLVPNLSGIGRYVWEMSRALKDRGHSVILYMPEPPRYQMPYLEGVKIKTGKSYGAIRRVFWGAAELSKEIRLDSLDIFWGPAHRLPRGVDNVTPCVVTIHDLVWRRAKETMRWQTWLGERLFMGPAIRRSDTIVAVSEATLKDIAFYYPDAAPRIHAVYPGVTHLGVVGDVKSRAANWGMDRPYALFVGTLEPRKNLNRLLEAYSLLDKKTRDKLFLVLVGGRGWGMSEIPHLLKKYKVEDTVKKLGYVSDETLFFLYKNAKFLVMPSIYEGFGLPIIEAQSLGTPVITSNVSSMPEVAGDGAVLVDPMDVNEIAFAMRKLANDEEFRQNLGQKAQRNSMQFSWSAAAVKLESIFEATIEAKRKCSDTKGDWM